MFMKAAVLAAAIAASAAPVGPQQPAPVAGEPGYYTFDVEKSCNPVLGTCTVPQGFLYGILQTNVEMDQALVRAIPAARAELSARQKEIDRLRKENTDLKAMKGCAKMDVTVPPKLWKSG
jgi:hypothetical protein